MPKVYSSYSSKEKNFYKKPFYKTKGFYILLAAVVLISGFVIWSITKSPAAKEQTNIVSDQEKKQEKYEAIVNFVRGEAEYLEKQGSIWKNVSFSQKIKTGMTVKTAADSKLEMTFPDGSLIRLNENSSIVIEELSPADVIISHQAGNAYHRVNPNSTAIYKTIVNGDEITALGTAFNTESKNSDMSEVTVVESKVKVKVYKDNLLINMRTIEQGDLCVIDKTKDQKEVIETKKAEKEKLLENKWLSWNKEQDQQKSFSLGIFSDEVELKINKPANGQTTTNKNSYTIEGATEKEAVVKIAGVKVSNDEGSFSHEIELSKGENTIEIIAELDEKQTKKEIIITYDEDAEEEEEIDGFTLSADKTDNNVKLTWEIDSGQPEKGFKLLRSSSANPEYPGSDYKYIIQNDARVYTWRDLNNGTHHFRACLYTEDGACKAYSNDVSVTIEKEEETEKDGSINLSGSADGTKAKLSWSVSNLNAPKGFKVVKSTGPNPVYPGNDYKYLSDPKAGSLKWDLPAGTYHFRVCEYLGGKCGIYSNDVTVKIESAEPAQTGSISLSGSVNGASANLSWSVDGVDAPKGFKVVKSTDPNPVYPGNDYKYLSDSGARSIAWSGLSAGTYHFRVCQYLGGSCGIYSNDISLTIEESSQDTGTGSISLNGSSSNGNAYLSWSTSGSLNLDKGYKVVVSESANPVYPGNEYHYISDPGTKSDTWSGLSVGKTYHFRVCQYLGGSCGAYSNDLSLTIK